MPTPAEVLSNPEGWPVRMSNGRRQVRVRRWDAEARRYVYTSFVRRGDGTIYRLWTGQPGADQTLASLTGEGWLPY